MSSILKRRSVRISFLAAVVAVSVIVIGCGGVLPSGFITGTLDASKTPAEHAQDVLTLTNAQRADEGAPALGWNATLATIAANYAQYMADHNRFNHYDLAGNDVADRADDAGYVYSKIGENIAKLQSSATQVVSEWMASPTHKANILDPQFTELGVGVATDASGAPYWVQVFGRP